MPWNVRDAMSLRRELVALASQPDANISALCRRFGVSRTTGYTWLGRAEELGAERSRRPHRSPKQTPSVVEDDLVAVRQQFPDWGPRKIRRYLVDRGRTELPSVSTISAILKRRGLISAQASEAAQHWLRFEHPHPNALWQMDFKGHFAMTHGRCHALTVIDDHSRFNLVLQACASETYHDVQPALERCFRRYGLPQRISCDNGPPWGTTRREDRLTQLGAWLIHLGIGLSHARPYHPQTNGKDERFHRTLDNGLLKRRILVDYDDAQRAFDEYRDLYNLVRPHDALQLAVPASRYRCSDRQYPQSLPTIEYDSNLPVRIVDVSGRISFKNQRFRISKALYGKPVSLQPDPDNDAIHRVYFCHHHVRSIDLRYPEAVE